jgi:protein-L-isoaspartate(D-aspartate) O-methyltransferase
MGGRLAIVSLGLLASACGSGPCVTRPIAAGPAAGPASAPADEAGHGLRRERMVERQIVARGVRDPAVLAAMRAVPRHRFVRPVDWDDAYEDHPLGIGLGQTISQPYIVAAMTEALALKSTDRVLEIGTGSGYQAAVLARVAREVYTIEIVAQLARRAERTLVEVGAANVKVRTGDGFLGWPQAAPFDAIMITAATPKIPQPLVDQLAEGGRLCAPVDEGDEQVLMLYTKRRGRLVKQELFPVRFVPMTGKVRE